MNLNVRGVVKVNAKIANAPFTRLVWTYKGLAVYLSFSIACTGDSQPKWILTLRNCGRIQPSQRYKMM